MNSNKKTGSNTKNKNRHKKVDKELNSYNKYKISHSHKNFNTCLPPQKKHNDLQKKQHISYLNKISHQASNFKYKHETPLKNSYFLKLK